MRNTERGMMIGLRLSAVLVAATAACGGAILSQSAQFRAKLRPDTR